MHSPAVPPGQVSLSRSALTASQLTTLWSIPQEFAAATPDKLGWLMKTPNGRTQPGAARKQYPPLSVPM